jgi:hypothetical protein
VLIPQRPDVPEALPRPCPQDHYQDMGLRRAEGP